MNASQELEDGIFATDERADAHRLNSKNEKTAPKTSMSMHLPQLNYLCASDFHPWQKFFALTLARILGLNSSWRLGGLAVPSPFALRRLAV
jgi:hypothetical protein